MPQDTLSRGHGPRVFEAFLEPTCPFSARAYPKLADLLALCGPDRVTVRVRLLSQPWHLFSGVVTRAILAAARRPDGAEAAHKVLAAVFAHRADFEFDHHCEGPNLDASPRQILARIEALSGVELAPEFFRHDLDKDMKWQAKYARQNGAHVTPSFMVDGLMRPDLGSGDPVQTWAEALGLA